MFSPTSKHMRLRAEPQPPSRGPGVGSSETWRGDQVMKLRVAKLAAATLLGVSLGAASTFAGTANKDVINTALAAGQFKTLTTAINAAGLTAFLEGPGPFTVFAPTDAAFAALPPGTVENLLKPENKA